MGLLFFEPKKCEDELQLENYNLHVVMSNVIDMFLVRCCNAITISSTFLIEIIFKHAICYPIIKVSFKS
jgi:hypothetical protein